MEFRLCNSVDDDEYASVGLVMISRILPTQCEFFDGMASLDGVYSCTTEIIWLRPRKDKNGKHTRNSISELVFIWPGWPATGDCMLVMQLVVDFNRNARQPAYRLDILHTQI